MAVELEFEEIVDEVYAKNLALVREYFPGLLVDLETLSPRKIANLISEAEHLRSADRLYEVVSKRPFWVQEFAEYMLLSAI